MAKLPIRFVMLVSPIPERQENAQKIKEIIPNLELMEADKATCDLFMTHLKTMQTDPEKYRGVCMIEDDVILCNDFMKHFGQVMKDHDQDIVNFFEHALATRPLSCGYDIGGRFYSSVCYYVPAKMTQIFLEPEMLRMFHSFYNDMDFAATYPIDAYIQFVLNRKGLKYWRQFPWLVQHMDLESTFEGRVAGRQSKFFIDDMEAQDGKTEERD